MSQPALPPLRALVMPVLLGMPAAFLGPIPAWPQPIRPKIEAIGVQLFYETSGTLSENIAPPAAFVARNTVIGEGDAREPATDLLVTVRLSIPQDQGNGEVPLRITVAKRGGKVLASRRFAGQFFTKGRAVKALFVPDAACAGVLAIEARLGKETRSTEVAMNCGE